jgi:hypothetical protein
MKFFKNLYVKFVQWLAVFFLRHADTNIRYLLTTNYRSSDLKCFAEPLLLLTNEVMRQNIINVGKNPDYVALSPPEPPVRNVFPDTPYTFPHSFSSVGSEWVNDSSKHPVLKSRAKWENASKPETLKVNIHITDDSPTHSTTFGGDAINSLREAIQDIEEVLQPTESNNKSE